MNEKQQQLTFDKGITNVPSDALCSDNALAESVGMVYDNGEHRVVQKPAQYMTSVKGTLLYVHKLNNNEYYIVLDVIDNVGKIKWGTKNSSGVFEIAQEGGSDLVLVTISGDVKVTSIGNTLIITDSNGMYYCKWNGIKYERITWPIPSPVFSAKISASPLGYFVDNTGSPEGIIDCDISDHTFSIAPQKQEDYNNLVIGLYSKNLKEIAQQKMFAKPFFVRAALEMYDGSYVNITNPILLFPSLTENTRFFMFNEVDGTFIETPRKIVAVTQMFSLYVRQAQPFSDYSDIIKDVVIFATKGVNIYKTTQDQPINNELENFTIGDSISSQDDDYTIIGPSEYRTTTYSPSPISGLVLAQNTLRCLLQREAKAVQDDIESESQFYKIASLGLNPINNYVDIASKTTSEILENLDAQERLPYDDYFSRNKLVPKLVYAYNSRLNLANVSRGFFDGFSFFMPFDQQGEYSYTFDTTIKTDSDEVRVRAVELTNQKQGIYFYYPDSRAKHVKIYKTINRATKLILDADLTEHPFLNGAYYFAGVSASTDEPEGTAADLPANPSVKTEMLYNRIIQSEASNPWLFLASGYHTVGFSDIVGMSTVTQALSEGQFGAYPLIVFSKEGIWAMSVDGTGLYNTIHPMNREVCINPSSIIQTDGAVFFASKKGLMVVVGSQVKCVSEQLSGKTNKFSDAGYNQLVKDLGNFCDFLKDAFIAYDYRDSLLWIFDGKTRGSSPAVKGLQTCYVYSIKSGTFGKYDFGTGNVISSVVNNYPDYLLQNETTIYSLTGRDDINVEAASATTYTANILTRPMKLENALAIKSLMQIRHILQFTPYNVTETHEDPETHETVTTTTTQKGSMTLRIFASNNLDNWVELHSLRGTPWKYYRFLYDFAGLKATDRFAGTMLITQERRSDKLR